VFLGSISGEILLCCWASVFVGLIGGFVMDNGYVDGTIWQKELKSIGGLCGFSELGCLMGELSCGKTDVIHLFYKDIRRELSKDGLHSFLESSHSSQLSSWKWEKVLELMLAGSGLLEAMTESRMLKLCEDWQETLTRPEWLAAMDRISNGISNWAARRPFTYVDDDYQPYVNDD
jgi:hypothetical protein